MSPPKELEPINQLLHAQTIDEQLGHVQGLAESLMQAIGVLPESVDRTKAHARAEECLAYLTKLRDEHE